MFDMKVFTGPTGSDMFLRARRGLGLHYIVVLQVSTS